MASFPGDRASLKSGNVTQHQTGKPAQSSEVKERAASATSAAARHDTLLQEFAAELTPTPEELAAAFGPGAKADTAGPQPQSGEGPASAGGNLDVIMRIPVSVQVVLGSATMSVSGLVKLGRGAVIPLDRHVGEPVDVVVNGRVIARGEVVVMEEATSRFGISLTEVVTGSGSARGA